MPNLARTLVAAVLAAAVLAPSADAAQGPDPVVVTNPVTLNPATANPVMLNPAASNPVTVTNPGDVAKAAVAHPFHFIVSCTQFFGASGCRREVTEGPVPNQPSAGTLVIEFMSGACDLAPGVILAKVQLSTEIAGLVEPHFFALTDHTGGGSGTVTFAQSGRIYHDNPSLGFNLTASSQTAPDAIITQTEAVNCFVTLSGQVVN